MPRALLHIHRATNLGSALPFAHALLHTEQWELAVMATPFDREAGVGLPEPHLARLRKLGLPMVNSPQEHQPDVTFTFEPVESHLEGTGLLVRLPGGVTGRGVRFSEGRTSLVDNLADLLLVPGHWHEDRIRQAGVVFTEVAAVGLPSLDPLTANWLPPREVFCQQLRIAPDRKVILYVPGHEPERSSLPILWTRVGKLADDGDLLILRPHPYTDPRGLAALEELADRHPNILMAKEVDIQAYLRLASVVVTDTTSAGFEAAALGIPVVLFDNPNLKEDTNYIPGDPEYAFRDLFPRAQDLAGLRREVRRVLADPSTVSQLVQTVRSRLILVGEGTATQRILEATIKALEKRKHPNNPDARVTVLLHAQDESPAAVEASLESLLQEGGILSRALLLAKGERHEQLTQLTKRWADRVTILTPDEFKRDLVETPFAAFVTPGVRLGQKGLLRLVNHLRRHAELDAVVPMLPAGAPGQDPRILLNLPLDQKVDLPMVDRDLAVTQAGVVAKAISPVRGDIAVVRNPSAAADTVTKMALHSADTLPSERLGVAVDALAMHPDWAKAPLWERSAPLSRKEIAEAERRIRELSTWIGRIMPQPRSMDNKRTVSAQDADNDNADGRLRLALHYEKRGNYDMAKRHLYAYQTQRPKDPEAMALAERLKGVRTLTAVPNREI